MRDIKEKTMLCKIKHRLAGTVLFSLETESLRLCVEAAVKLKVDLSYANLSYADLSKVDLSYANLRYADLSYANLSYAKLRDDIIITQLPICIQGLTWPITIWDHHMQIGCEFHSHDEWRNFDAQWAKINGKDAIKFRRDHMAWLDIAMTVHAGKVKKRESEEAGGDMNNHLALGTKERRDQEKYFGEGEEPKEDDLVFLRPQAD